MLLRSTKNLLLDAVRKRFDPALFEGVDEPLGTGDSKGFVIRLRGSRLEFTVRHSPINYHFLRCVYTEFNPEFTHSEGFPLNGFTDEVETISRRFKDWLDFHVAPYLKELATPDLWSMVAEERSLFESAGLRPGDLDGFSSDEKLDTRDAIKEFERHIHATFMPSAHQAEAIAAQLKYLATAVDRLNHIDWRSLLLSTVISISTALGLNTETGRQLFELAKHVFAGALRYFPG